jgi:TatD DNase family protein
MLFDSHCHITDDSLLPHVGEVRLRAASAGVSRILAVAVDLEDSTRTARVADGTGVWATAGVHPQEALGWSEAHSARLGALLREPFVVAVGEIGLDYLYDESHPEHPGASRVRQEQVLEAQLALAAERGLPVVLHNRLADDRLVQIIASWRNRLTAGGVFHCMASDKNVARQILDLGFYLGFTGLITFKSAESVRESLRLCPLERLLIETDSPYLAPVPYRGRVNEPAYVAQVAVRAAEVKEIGTPELAEITTQNALRLFNIRE